MSVHQCPWLVQWGLFVLLCSIFDPSGAVLTTFGRTFAAPRLLPSRQTDRCSDLFTVDHENTYAKFYEGKLNLRPLITLPYMQVVLQFDREVELLTNYFHKSTDDYKTFHITNMTHSFPAGHNIQIPLSVAYQSVKPTLERIDLNGVTICPTTVRTLGRNYAVSPAPILNDRSVQTWKNSSDDRTQQQFNSTCQAIQTAVVVSGGRWDAVMNLVADSTLSQAVIEIVFDHPIYILGNPFGEVTTQDSIRFRIENRTFIIAKDAEIELNFFVRFNQAGPVPDVAEVNFNGRNHCQQRRRRVPNGNVADTVRPRATTFATITDPFYGRETIEPSVSAESRQEEDEWILDEAECATVVPSKANRIRSRIIGGIESGQGEHPWHVAIYVEDQYQCGGSIVGKRWILSAAHCLTRQNTNQTLDVEQFRVYTGIIDISQIEDHFYRSVESVIIHREFNPAMFTTDIGLLRLTRDIVYNSFIKPVCLYNRTVDISGFYGRDGKVTGWGFDRNGVVSNMLNYLEVPVVSQKMCSQKNVQFNVVLAVGESFCAGHADGNAVCNGDSGGGLVFAEGSRYYIRGIVSISAQRRNQLLCDPNQYSVFTDVSKFRNWIRQHIS
ncbi:transmembrane protease [Anopheles darlingi]|uniref:Transmembrane protease n=1 Tax=Anopheles darlingi TaxID=43151 RepID=W5JV64_ANODA|nr:transmembrane protease [Anopheles darlingi]